MVAMVNRQPNTLVSIEDVEEYVILVGGEDPSLTHRILSDAVPSSQQIAESRGFITLKCESAKAMPFTLAITGVGPSATEIAVTEYANCGARVILRAGTSGALSDKLEIGSVVITTKALRFDGVSDLYTWRRLKAIADAKVVEALKCSAKNLSIKYAPGLTVTTSSFYAMGGTSEDGKIAFSGKGSVANFEPTGLAKLRDLIARDKPLNIEMESATLLILARLYGLKAGSVCGISNKVPWEEGEQAKFTELALRNAILVAIGALDCLHHKRTQSRQSG